MTREPEIRPARPSSSVCLLRPVAGGSEVLMARRGAAARFMAGAWVFPGGMVDDDDRGPAAMRAVRDVAGEHAAWVAAGLRELVEEAGVWLGDPPRTLPAHQRPIGAAVHTAAATDPFDAGRLSLFSNWVTPTAVPYRFDARFYVATVPPGTTAIADGVEMEAVRWVRPSDALDEAAAGRFVVPFPTRVTLEAFATLGDPTAIVDHARSLTEVVPVMPRLRLLDDGTLEVLVPGDSGYADIEDLPPDPAVLGSVVTVTTATGLPVPEMGRHGD